MSYLVDPYRRPLTDSLYFTFVYLYERTTVKYLDKKANIVKFKDLKSNLEKQTLEKCDVISLNHIY